MKTIKQMTRSQVINTLVDSIEAIEVSQPKLIAVSGITASGKSTLASEVYQCLTERGHETIRASIDDFHHCSQDRNNQDKPSWQAYYENAHDYESLLGRLIRPLADGGDRRFQLGSLDLAKDIAIDPSFQTAGDNAYMVIDGTFLFKPTLNPFWHYRIFVDTDFEVARARGVKRDSPNLGGEAATEQKYLQRYHKASEVYLREVNPAGLAQAIVKNNNVEAPQITFY
jgi:uridine kinase